MNGLRTSRLRLFPLRLDDLRRLLTQGRPAMEEALRLKPSNLEVPPGLEEEYRTTLMLALTRVSEYPEAFRWHTVWEIVLHEARQSIGGLGLAGPPDDDGDVLIAYWLDRRYHNQGFMTEAVGGISLWVLRQRGARSVTASVAKSNKASERVLAKNSFTPIQGGAGVSRWIRRRD